MFELIVLDIGYGVLKCGIVGLNKIVWIHKFPPAFNTTSKPVISDADRVLESDFEYEYNKELRKETVVNFWASTELYQANGDWKGGEWGSNNLPTTSTNFCTGVFIGDSLMMEVVADGIIPYKKRLSLKFESDDTSDIIEGSELFAWSANIKVLNSSITYSCYVCDNPMPQSAIDVLFVWENSLGHKFIKILRRGPSNPNVDMPNMIMPGAGEHREPGNKISIKADALRAVCEEIGIGDDALSKCYLIPIGVFGEKKRDPRYWTYSVIQDGKMMEFGPERESETNVFILYIKTDTEKEPDEINYTDTIEIGKKYWIGLDNHLILDNKLWMIQEHISYVRLAKNILSEFELRGQEEKEQFKFNV